MKARFLCLRLESMEISIQNCCSPSSLFLFNLRAATSINSQDQKRYHPCRKPLARISSSLPKCAMIDTIFSPKITHMDDTCTFEKVEIESKSAI
ncbi:hypothetical protein Tco_1421484 [Tanacetum coccineum]